MIIEEFILEGAENAISLSDLAHVAGISDRAVRREVDDARIKRKALIIGDENGYYFPAEIADIRGYVCRRKASISTSKKALAPFVNALRGHGNG